MKGQTDKHLHWWVWVTSRAGNEELHPSGVTRS